MISQDGKLLHLSDFGYNFHAKTIFRAQSILLTLGMSVQLPWYISIWTFYRHFKFNVNKVIFLTFLSIGAFYYKTFLGFVNGTTTLSIA